jgi:hypothetical protein
LDNGGSLHATGEYRKALARISRLTVNPTAFHQWEDLEKPRGIIPGGAGFQRVGGRTRSILLQPPPQAEASATKKKHARQWHPQEFGVQPPQPPSTANDSLAEEEPHEDFPALKTESCKMRRSLAHFGHATFCRADITMDS